jgi:hypothetical protein
MLGGCQVFFSYDARCRYKKNAWWLLGIFLQTRKIIVDENVLAAMHFPQTIQLDWKRMPSDY